MLSFTGSPAQAGVVAGLARLPYLALALVAGVFVDRWDRKRTMIVCDAARAFALGGVAVAVLTDRLSMPQLYATALLEGTLFTFFSVAEAAALPSIVESEQLGTAFAQREMAWSGSGILAPGLGGLLYQLARFIPFAADAVSYGLSTVSLVLVKRPLQADQSGPRRPLVSELVEGVRWLIDRPVVLSLTLLSGGLDLVIGGTVLVLILVAREQHATAETIGLMLSIGSIGPVLGYVAAPHVQHRYSLAQVLTVTLWLEVGLWMLYLLTPSPPIIGLIMAAAGAVASVYIVTDVTYRSRAVPDELRGRLNGLFGLLPFGLQSLSLVLAGAVSQLWNPSAAIVAFLVILSAMASWVTVSRVLRCVQGG